MSALKTTFPWIIISLIIMVASHAHADVVTYSLDNVILDDNNAQMFGEFTWTYDVGDFENGDGQFTYLDIPYTAHNHTDLNTTIDVGSSIEITLEGSVHDDGVDITLVLLQPLTATSGSLIDLGESHFEIGGNGFHTGIFLSGNILLSNLSGVEEQPISPMPTNTITNYPNPFNPRTNLVFELDHQSIVRLEIFDMRGRSIRTLTQSVHSPGIHSVIWDGTDRHGQSVPSGRYFARMQAGAEIVTQPMMLVR